MGVERVIIFYDSMSYPEKDIILKNQLKGDTLTQPQ